jgi:hypothetical protein
VVDRFVPEPKMSPDLIGASTRNNKEVDDLKKIVFLIIASLLLIGLALPGCGGGGGEGGFTNWLTIGVVCPMSVPHGQQQWLCAQWAQSEINTAGGVNVSGTVYGIKLTKINTLTEEVPELAQAALQAVIDDVDYVIGGFRTETVFPLVETTMDEQKLFLIAGAATADICRQVAWNNTRYKYIFRGTPFNDVFLLTNMYKWLGTLSHEFFAQNFTPPWKLSVIAENLDWTATMRAILQYDLLGVQAEYNYTTADVTLVDPTATSISTELQSIADSYNGTGPLVIMPILSAAQVGALYSNNRLTYLPDALSFGINVYAQTSAAYTLTSGGCLGEMFLDNYGYNCSITDQTLPFMSGFATRSAAVGAPAGGTYPMYTASVYDMVKALATAIDAANSIDDAALVTYMRQAAKYPTAGAKGIKYYPMPELTLVAGNASENKVMALNASQAFALYPHLVEYYNAINGTNYANYNDLAANWMSDGLYLDWTDNPGGFVPNDLVYGPGFSTGIITQWQNLTGVGGKKVSVWPNTVSPQLAALSSYTAAQIHSINATLFNVLVQEGVIDQYGSWIINYPGTKAPYIPQSVINAWGP